MKDQETATVLMCQARLGMQLAQAHLRSAESALDGDGSVEAVMANLISAGLAMANCLGKFNAAVTVSAELRAATESPNPKEHGRDVLPEECGITTS